MATEEDDNGNISSPQTQQLHAAAGKYASAEELDRPDRCKTESEWSSLTITAITSSRSRTPFSAEPLPNSRRKQTVDGEQLLGCGAGSASKRLQGTRAVVRPSSPAKDAGYSKNQPC